MKKADIYIDDSFCGILTEDSEGYHFSYDGNYLKSAGAKAISPTMPLTESEYSKNDVPRLRWTDPGRMVA